MNISWIKYKKETDSFRMFQTMGMPVIELADTETPDKKIEELIDNNCHTIILTKQVADQSEKMMKRCKEKEDINIIITPKKNL